MDEKQLLDKITSGPAPHTLHHEPARFELRVAELLRDALNAHADAELKAAKQPSAEQEEEAKFRSQRLWALVPALLAIPPQKRHLHDGDAGSSSKFDMVEM
eukprot:4618350-Karenia_brevis.AAC.1